MRGRTCSPPAKLRTKKWAKGGATGPVVAAIEIERERERRSSSFVAAMELAHGPTRLLLLRAVGTPKAGAEGPVWPNARERWVTMAKYLKLISNKQRWVSETGKNLFSSQYKWRTQVNKMDFSGMNMFGQHHNPIEILFHTIGDKKERHSEYTKALTNTDHMLMMLDHLITTETVGI